ncbi:putative transmembrane protein domain-containing protein [Ditylenchus destructor]|uniref:Transmembrane protein domain-containing protein n=1 Tax=Ditylenchus destructor TaxID=166010 RepID=A0AAD4R6T6_9BILA|nr:putative transmembrane protein domain-containing protein [Ditylenchus destructor]
MDETILGSNFSISDVLALKNYSLVSFWQQFSAIFIWMAVSYVVAHLIAFSIAVTMLRHHQWVLYISCPFLVMSVLGPTTLGALTSASIALTFAMANKAITPWHCMIIGCGQTFFVILTSFFRILATL